MRRSRRGSRVASTAASSPLPSARASIGRSRRWRVARAALALPGTGNVERVGLLGTPHRGSFAAVQAMRGTYAVVRKVARLATRTSAEDLAAEVFSTFPSLYDLLPAHGDGNATD